MGAVLGDEVKAVLRRLLPRKLQRWAMALVLDVDARRFARQNRSLWGGWDVPNPDGQILVDFHSISQTHVAYAYFLNVLARQTRSEIVAFLSIGKWSDPVLRKVYSSFNARRLLRVELSPRWAGRIEETLAGALDGMESKQALLDLECHGVRIGLDVYESYLRRYGAATVDLKDPRLIEVLREAVVTLLFWEDHLERYPVSAVVVSHDCYVEHNIICRLAYQRGVPVFFPSALGMKRADRPYSTAIKYRHFREMFARIPEEEQGACLALARQQLERRTAGEQDPGMAYVTTSSFDPKRRRGRVLNPGEGFKVLICTHCFHDNPHIYEPLPFVDFTAWLEFLRGVAERTKYDWYVKVHPDPLPGTEETIRHILGDESPIKLIPPGVPHQQLVEEGIDFVLTVYGTVGHEYPVLGVPVLNAAFNPHIAYGFNWHARSVEEYEDLLMRLPDLKKEIDLDEVYEFYYMHYYHTRPDDLFFPSFRSMVQELTPFERVGSRAYGYFLDRLTEARHQQIIERVRSFLAAGTREYFSRGPEIDMAGTTSDPGDPKSVVLARGPDVAVVWERRDQSSGGVTHG